MTWSYFDSIYCINLYTREDRYNNSKKLFNKLDIPVKFHRVNKHIKGGLQGCFESHVDIISTAYYKGDKRILIFEDDIRQGYSPGNLELCISFMKTFSSWDIFYLGAVPDLRKDNTFHIEGFPGIYKLSGICTHAYVINRKAMKKIKNLKYTGVPYDFYLRDNMECYAIYPSLFYQGGFASDITEKTIIDMHAIINPQFSTLGFKILEGYAYYVGVSFPRLFVFILCVYIAFKTKVAFKEILIILFIIIFMLKK